MGAILASYGSYFGELWELFWRAMGAILASYGSHFEPNVMSEIALKIAFGSLDIISAS